MLMSLFTLIFFILIAIETLYLMMTSQKIKPVLPQFREIIEEAVDGSRDAKKEWKSFGSEIQKKEKEEAASRYLYTGNNT